MTDCGSEKIIIRPDMILFSFSGLVNFSFEKQIARIYIFLLTAHFVAHMFAGLVLALWVVVLELSGFPSFGVPRRFFCVLDIGHGTKQDYPFIFFKHESYIYAIATL